MRSSDLDFAGAEVAGGAKLPQLHCVGGAEGAAAGRSHSSSWRYASASIGNSADSDSYSGLMASVAAEEGGLAVAGSAASSLGAAVGGSTDAAAKQLWSPTKRPQLAAQPTYDPPGATAGALGVPPGMDAAAYAAGERAAFMRAFQQALPGQQALGQLFAAVDGLHSRLEEETVQWRQLQVGASKTSGLLETLLQRLDTLEFMRLPQLQERAEEAASRPPKQLLELVAGLQQVVALLAQQRQMLTDQQQQQRQAAALLARPRSVGTLHWLLLAAAGYAQSLLSKADVAALFLSRKILLVEGSDSGKGGSSSRRQLSSALSVLLFVASVEAAWQLHSRATRPLPAFARGAAAPLQLGLRVARAAVWSAALVLAAAQTRASCHAAGDRICAAAEAAVASVKLPRWAAQLPGWRILQRWQARQGAAVPTGGEEAAPINEGRAVGSCQAGSPTSSEVVESV